jgi:hypothetical protein
LGGTGQTYGISHMVSSSQSPVLSGTGQTYGISHMVSSNRFPVLKELDKLRLSKLKIQWLRPLALKFFTR